MKALRALWADADERGLNEPLIITAEGASPTKAQVVDEIAPWAVYLQAPQGNCTGHSLRTTGAQRLAMAGVSEAKIRMFGRWASEAMLRYVRQSLLAQSGVVVAKQVEDGVLTSSSSSAAAGSNSTARRWSQATFRATRGVLQAG